MKFFLCVAGMVMFVEGLPYAAIPAQMKSIVHKILEMPEADLRKYGLVLMVAGLLTVYLGTR